MMFDYGNSNLNNREVPLFSLDDHDRKIIKHMKLWAGASIFMRIMVLCSYFLGIILTCTGALYLENIQYAPVSVTSAKCQLAFGIIFIIFFFIALIHLIMFDFKLAKYAKVLQKYDTNTKASLITRYYWAVAQHKWLFFFFMMRIGFFLDFVIISQCRKALKLKQLTPQEEQAKEEEWLNNFTNAQTNDRSIAYRLSLRHKKDDTAHLTNSTDPTKN